jgi:hypothetical protein
MLPFAVTFFLLAMIILGFNAAGAMTGGAVAFATGFLILAVMGGLSVWRNRPA